MERGDDIVRRGEGTSGSGVDLAALAVRRLALGSWMAIGVAVVAGVVSFLRQPNIGVRAGTERPFLLWVVGAVLSVVMLVIARAERLTPARRVDAGLAYVCAICFLASLFRHWLPYADSDVVRGVPPGAIVVLFYATLVPVSPPKMAGAAVVCALSDTAALAITVWGVGNPTPPWNLWLWLLLPNVVVVVLAYFTSRFVFQLGETVRRAREMGAYRLVELLGQGGMGEVWRADHHTLARPAAIKLVRPSLLGSTTGAERALERFEREARATAALTSPHTIAVYDFGRAEDGVFYYVMELLEGMDLQTMVRDHGPLPETRAVHMLLQVCHSLSEAHARGVIHRDIKPANLFVCHVGTERDFLKVLDFGIVKLQDAPPEAQSGPLTDAGSLLGTPGYMAPETTLGQDASPSSDLYAVGCVAYFLLTGRQVFEGLAPLQQLFAHGYEEVEPPSAHATLDPGLNALVMRCLAKDPVDRFGSMGELATALRELGLAGIWTPADAERWWATVDAGPRPAGPPSTDPYGSTAVAPTEELTQPDA
ncbi:MAG: serine/threonine protein kinase [Sandaracinaceae bacterium]|nr:serine/threonine protein kinase [Sandaracinaceae bacterium]